MPEPPPSFRLYNDAWNERDLTRVRALLDRSLADNVTFTDPANQVAGIDAIEKMIREARAAFPDADYELTTAVDGHNRRYRYRWEVRRPGQPSIPGMDVTTINDAGLIERIDGFFGDFPPLT